MNAIEPSAELLAGRRAIEGLTGCKIVEDLRWDRDAERWVLVLTLSVDRGTSRFVPMTTRWYVLLSPDYPQGRVGFYPAAEKGLTATFPHQLLNKPRRDRLWRSGLLCLDTPLAGTERLAPPSSPRTVEGRLTWYVRRARTWLERAARGELLRAGEEYELPDFDGEPENALLIHAETRAGLSRWTGRAPSSGSVRLSAFRTSRGKVWVVREFRDPGGALVAAVEWGEALDPSRGTDLSGGWVLLPRLPVMDPWRAARTWGELRLAARDAGADLDALLEPVLRPLAGKGAPILLIGAPIPAKVGEESSEVHWQPLRLPVVPRRRHRRGSKRRPTTLARTARRMGLGDSEQLRWGCSENWSAERLGARGRLAQELRGSQVALIGAGALGSSLAELLVRGGATSLSVIDGDTLEAGNLVRHTLGLSDVGRAKSLALRARLEGVNPHARIASVESYIDSSSAPPQELLGDAEVVVDCTASDELLDLLGSVDSGRERLWISASVGFEARHLYLFVGAGRCFPTARFRELFEPWRHLERAPGGTTREVQEGPGCWSPLFPARYDAIVRMASLAVSEINAFMRTAAPRAEAELLVLKEDVDEHGRVQRVDRITCVGGPTAGGIERPPLATG